MQSKKNWRFRREVFSESIAVRYPFPLLSRQVILVCRSVNWSTVAFAALRA